MPTLQFGQLPQPQGPYTITGSPTANPVAPDPSFSTQPAFSWPRVKGNGIPGVPAGVSKICRSEWQAPAPPIFIKTCPGPGSGTFTSRSSAGFCNSTNWNALMGFLKPLFDDPGVIDHQVSRAAKYIAAAVLRWVLDQPRVLHAANESLEREVHF